MTAEETAQGFGGYTRDELRRTYADAWRKQVAGGVLTPLDAMIAGVIGLHPEYQPFVQDAAAAHNFEHNAAASAENPFLHMGLHIAVREQISIDRPPGIREVSRALESRLGSPHDAEHALMEALAEALWEAQSAGRPPDEVRYMELARRRLEKRSGR